MDDERSRRFRYAYAIYLRNPQWYLSLFSTRWVVSRTYLWKHKVEAQKAKK